MPSLLGLRGHNTYLWGTGPEPYARRTTARKCRLCRMERSSQLQNCINRGGRGRPVEANYLRWLAIGGHSSRMRWTDLRLIALSGRDGKRKGTQK
jgi:hypothetical protein